MDYLVLIPTYNERENLTEITSAVLRQSEQAKKQGIKKFHILIIDDNSPDGTGILANELAHANENIFALNRPKKEGLAQSYIEGFLWGIHRKYDVLHEMDGDLSHNPKYLKHFWNALKSSDVVIGSRYIKEGGTKNWNAFRKLISLMGNRYAQALLGLGVHDLTGGYNAWKRTVLETIDFSSIRSNGSTFQVELKYLAWKKKLFSFGSPLHF